MKLTAKYIRKDNNPFIPDFSQWTTLFKYMRTGELPDDTDMEQMMTFAEEATPEGYTLLMIISEDITSIH